MQHQEPLERDAGAAVVPYHDKAVPPWGTPNNLSRGLKTL
jgi:hypothetical protein